MRMGQIWEEQSAHGQKEQGEKGIKQRVLDKIRHGVSLKRKFRGLEYPTSGELKLKTPSLFS